MNSLSYSASGKLLLFGEYLVLKGSLSFSIPLSVGQNLHILPYSGKGILWQCFEFEKCWLEIYFSEKLEIIYTTDIKKALPVQKLLLFIRERKHNLGSSGLCFKFDLNFNRYYGFGTSATLISLLSQWSGLNPYLLSAQSLDGSGYDIATATAKQPILYSMAQKVTGSCSLPESVTQQLLFVYRGKKQISASEVASFKNKQIRSDQIEQMNALIASASRCTHISAWEKLMQESEQLIAPILGVPAVKEQQFADYPYAIKSLGAWGGDFIMVAFRDLSEAKNYFMQKQIQSLYTYRELIKQR